MYEKVLEIQRETLGEEHDETKKTETYLKNTRTWMNNLSHFGTIYSNQ